MPTPEYRADQIRVLTFDEAVRNRPVMYFGCAADDPAFPAAVLRRVVDDALAEPARVRVVIESDHRFTLVDDAVAEPGTRVTFDLDTTYFVPGATLPRDALRDLDAAEVSCLRSGASEPPRTR